jgi:hypothetical protein
MFFYDAWIHWLDSLDHSYLFIGVLPFAIVVVALWSKYASATKAERDDSKRQWEKDRP